MKQLILILLFPLISYAQHKTGSVIFIHPDGASASHWSAMRTLYFGPDSDCNWDKLPDIGLYREHCRDNLTPESTSGGTIHSYGIKTGKNSFGLDINDTIISRSGKKMSIMHEAILKGIKTGLINSGSIIEPGTAAFIARVGSRKDYAEITKQIVESGVDVILSGGEEWFLPETSKGRHIEKGKRTDGLDLIKSAKNKGYYIVYKAEELKNIPPNTEKLLGIFSEGHTFNDFSEEELKEKNLTPYKKGVPTLKEMTEAALKILAKDNRQFFLLVEEEGTDNFSNVNNASATLEALKRADDAIGYAIDFINSNSDVMLLTAADSDAGGLKLIGLPEEEISPDGFLPERMPDGSPIDGIEGAKSAPFISAPDRFGSRLPFAICWASNYDLSGGVVCRSKGANSEFVRGTVDNTDIFKFFYLTLFGEFLK